MLANIVALLALSAPAIIENQKVISTPQCVGSFCCNDVSCAHNCSSQGCNYGMCEVSLCRCHKCEEKTPECKMNQCGTRCMFGGCWSGFCDPNGDCQCNHCVVPNHNASKNVCHSQDCLTHCQDTLGCKYGTCNDNSCECHYCGAPAL